MVVLHRVQPLTTDVRDVTQGRVVVMTDGSASRVSRADVPLPPEVAEIPVGQWERVLRERARAGAMQVVTNDEYALGDLARVRDALGLEPVTPTHVDRYLDKVVMKRALRAEGIAVPRWHALPPLVGGVTMPDDLELPVVVKPRIGANSRGVRIIRTMGDWASWVTAHAGEEGWQVEQFIDGHMCFVDGLVLNGEYRPVLVGRYLGGLLPTPDTRVLGAVNVPEQSGSYRRAIALAVHVAHALGVNGRFATHLEFFDTGDRLVVMEVCARAPGAMVSEMARVVGGHNLESVHLHVQAGGSAPAFHWTGSHAAWISLLSRPGQPFLGPPGLSSRLILHHLPAQPGHRGRHVSAMGLLTNEDRGALTADVAVCVDHRWYA